MSTLVEAGDRLGGQFRLAGMQPRRGQIIDLLDWYARQLSQLGVEVRLNVFLDADEIKEFAAEKTVIATGSNPSDTGFQKAIPHVDKLPGIETRWSFFSRRCDGTSGTSWKACLSPSTREETGKGAEPPGNLLKTDTK